MENEQTDVKQWEETQIPEAEVETATESEENNEQVQEQVESDISTTDGKDYKAIAEQLSRDIREKNRKIQELKAQAQAPVAQSQPVISEDETVQRFLKTEANATIAVKLQTDPSFKDRVDIVQAYVEQGYDINMADKLAKADIMDKILTEASAPVQNNIPKQIQTSAIPEQVKQRSTGNALDDIQKGIVPLSENADAIREMLTKYRKR